MCRSHASYWWCRGRAGIGADKGTIECGLDGTTQQKVDLYSQQSWGRTFRGWAPKRATGSSLEGGIKSAISLHGKLPPAELNE